LQGSEQKNMATRSLERFSYSLHPRVTLYFKGVLYFQFKDVLYVINFL